MQKRSIQYNKIFAPIAKITLICILFIFVAIEDVEVHQMDAKTSFLNGDLEVKICMNKILDYYTKKRIFDL